jgi:Putative Actinobacterial Holin-X, holin superfamily III
LGWKLCSTGWICRSPSDLRAKSPELVIIGCLAFGAAAVLGWFALGCFLAIAILALALVLPAWLAALIVAVVVAIAAGIAALMGKKKVAEAGPLAPTDTVQSVKKDVEEIKESARR